MTDETHSEPKPRSPGRVFAFIGLTLFGLILLYVLSVGPAFLMVQHGIIDMNTLETVYRPLDKLTNNLPAVQKFFRWYIYDLWHVRL